MSEPNNKKHRPVVFNRLLEAMDFPSPVPKSLWSNPKAPPKAVGIWCVFWELTRGTGEAAQPSQAWVAKRLGVTRRAIIPAFAWMEDNGYLVGRRKSGKVTHYELTTPALELVKQTAQLDEIQPVQSTSPVQDASQPCAVDFTPPVQDASQPLLNRDLKDRNPKDVLTDSCRSEKLNGLSVMATKFLQWWYTTYREENGEAPDWSQTGYWARANKAVCAWLNGPEPQKHLLELGTAALWAMKEHNMDKPREWITDLAGDPIAFLRPKWVNKCKQEARGDNWTAPPSLVAALSNDATVNA